MEPLVSTEWLANALGEPDLRVIDATLFLPAAGRDARAEHEAKHIPGALFMDLDEVVDGESGLPHMLPGEAKFASRMRALGLRDGDRMVVYDNSPLHSAARAWWMLRTFGVRSVAILDGGFAKWKGEGRPTGSGPVEPGRGHFTPRLDRAAVADKALVAGAMESGAEILDARPGARFRGEEAEPRAGLAAGHIPGSKSLPQSELFEADGSWKRGEALRAAFSGVDLSKPMVTTCGSGITAAVLLFGAHLLGKDDVRLYDGSWAEWGADPKTPKAVGAA